VPLAELPVAAGQAAYKFPPLPFIGEFVGVLLSGGQVIGYDGFEVKPLPSVPGTVTRIGTGSCGNQGAAQPTLLHALQQGIDLFLYTGDNLYIDTYNANAMRSAYETFITNRTEYQQVRANVPVLATWDDHDYGCCDEDSDYPIKAQSQQIFLDFFEEPANSPRRTQQGIHTSYTFGNDGERLQIILLDTRYFLDDKRPNNSCGINDYCPWDSPSDTARTMLGSAQWAWLKTQLEQPADLRLVASSVQFSSSYHGFEQWRLFPHQRKRMQALIKQTGAEHLFFVSGDMHYAEVSRLDDDPALYPLYDFTASAINQSWPPEGNQNRVPGMVYGDPNIGLISIDWPGQAVTFTCLDAQNTTRFEHTVTFSEMEFDATGTFGKTPPNSLAVRQVPTPGTGMARLVFDDKTSGEVVVFDSQGQAVLSKVLESVTEVEIFLLPAGVYVAEVRSGKVATTVRLLVN
jgi:alkaline phosphatase D